MSTHYQQQQRPLTDRAFTIHNIQIIVNYACSTYDQTFPLAYVNRNFEETMKDFHTTHALFFKNFDFNEWHQEEQEQQQVNVDQSSTSKKKTRHLDIRGDTYDSFTQKLSNIFSARIPWIFRELTLRRHNPSPEYDACVIEALWQNSMLTTAMTNGRSLEWAECVAQVYYDRGLLKEALEQLDPDNNLCLLWRCITWNIDGAKLRLLIRLHGDCESVDAFTKTKNFGNTIVMKLVTHNNIFSAETLRVFLETCVKLNCLQTVLGCDENDKKQETSPLPLLSLCTNSDFKVAAELTADNHAFELSFCPTSGCTIDPEKIDTILHYFENHTTPEYRQPVLLQHGFKWLNMIFKFKLEETTVAKTVFRLFEENTNLLNQVLENGGKLIGVATRNAPSCLDLVLEFLEKHDNNYLDDKIFGVSSSSESFLLSSSIVRHSDTNAESLKKLFRLFKKKNNNDNKTFLVSLLNAEVLSTAAKHFTSAESLRVILQQVAEMVRVLEEEKESGKRREREE